MLPTNTNLCLFTSGHYFQWNYFLFSRSSGKLLESLCSMFSWWELSSLHWGEPLISSNMTSQCPDGAELGNNIQRCEWVPDRWEPRKPIYSHLHFLYSWESSSVSQLRAVTAVPLLSAARTTCRHPPLQLGGALPLFFPPSFWSQLVRTSFGSFWSTSCGFLQLSLCAPRKNSFA